MCRYETPVMGFRNVNFLQKQEKEKRDELTHSHLCLELNLVRRDSPQNLHDYIKIVAENAYFYFLQSLHLK